MVTANSREWCIDPRGKTWGKIYLGERRVDKRKVSTIKDPLLNCQGIEIIFMDYKVKKKERPLYQMGCSKECPGI